ncbi:hypothetical protein KPL40_17895 [Clostridium gasigenes]|uniref:hypothetical protein n=1 Tax=Clostridium gasigenes TaxID=94869 RepID=UPI001C0AEE97|nr:hypothetical protein [Clostridium gasigenes]MBU3134294.1 hypothetical protein [Clostridium gasigenes]
MRKFSIVGIVVLGIFILNGCVQNSKKDNQIIDNNSQNIEIDSLHNKSKKELYVSNYAIESQLSEVIVLDEEFNFLKKLDLTVEYI